MSTLLWLTDRTRYVTGTGKCGRERYLGTHADGYGYTMKGESLPLATGKYIHKGAEVLLGHLRDTDTLPSPEIVRHAVKTASDAYEGEIAARGYRGLLQNESSEYVIREQLALLGGMIWTLNRLILPWLFQNYRVLQVEQESLYILDCTCGLGESNISQAAHDARGCQGIGMQIRQDGIAAKRHGPGLAYFEIKTTGSSGDSWSSAWETKPQMALGSLGIQEKYGQEVTETFVVGLYKGSRKKSGEGASQIVRQESPFCYGYSRPANPPLAPDDWLPSYEWKDESGLTKRASRAHTKRGIWELPESNWPLYDRSIDPVEYWANHFLPQSVLAKQVFLVGPMITQQEQLKSLKRQIVGEERKWQDILWKLYELQQAGHEWSSETFQAALDHLIPASWECRRYGSQYECQFTWMCFRRPGWEDPLGSGKYVPRRPHHQPELDAAIERGLVVEGTTEGEEEE